MSNQWVPSRYNCRIRLKGKGSMLYNSYTGAIAFTDLEEEAQAQILLEKGGRAAELSGLATDMREAGFLVRAGTDELGQAKKLHDDLQVAKSMHLVIMPTEACNFRCTYCYQSFPRGAMERETIDGLKAYVRQAVQRIDQLAVSWFGGEPLLGPGVITELSDSFLESCKSHGVDYSADMSTNGYFLTRERFAELLGRNVRRFMVTLDGVGEVHDKRRTLRGGDGTYDKIIDNLKEIRSVAGSFAIDLRINFDENNVGQVPELLEQLSAWFGEDERFQILIRPVGRWGGPQDDHIPVCDRTAADRHLWELTHYGLEQGLALSATIADSLLPSGAVCYAAKPNSLVIGSDGRLYKCSVALDDESNRVGQLHQDGSLDLDMDKISRWTDSGEDRDTVCQACYFRPACQGNHCPLYRMRTGRRPCPHEKRKIKQVLNLLWKNIDPSKGGGKGNEGDSSCGIPRSSGEIG